MSNETIANPTGSPPIFTEPTDTPPEAVSIRSDEVLPDSNFLTLNDVRITPSHMLFDNAYEGKHYKEKLVIQNCGNRLAFIRLAKPNSSTFEFDHIEEGKQLSPGMKIVRHVKYTYMRALGVLKGFTTIWVNGNDIRYHFRVKLSNWILTIEPQLIDFGRIDAVNHATTRTFHITNSGCKGTHFAIDLGRNPLQMIVEPLKGTVPAMSSVAVKVEIVGNQEGEFTEEFWVKTKPPQRVVVTGIFISPKLLVRKFINSLDFTLIDFRPTYYGATSTQPLLIRNFSSSNSMFCVMGEIKGTMVTLEEARKMDDNYKNFIIKPVDGRLAALRGAMIQMTFAPVVTRARKDKNYAACFIKVVRMDCRDVTESDEIFENIEEGVGTSNTQFDVESTKTTASKEPENTPSDFSLSLDEDENQEDTFSFIHTIGVCLHGEKEFAGVVLRPTAITLDDLTLEKVYQRVVMVMNNSVHLPIRVRYNKVACVEVHPSDFVLSAWQSKEVVVRVRAVTLSREERIVTFDLLAEDLPKTGTAKKVGLAELQVSFMATKIEKKPSFQACVCEKLPPMLEPALPHRLTRDEMEKKLKNNEFWITYLRSLQTKPVEDNSEWHEYDSRQPLVPYGLKCGNIAHRLRHLGKRYPFYPLPPKLLYKIKITPKSIRLRKVAANTNITDFFVIDNENNFPILVYLKASKPFLYFEEDSRYIIGANEQRKMYFTFSNNSTGRYYINISVLINCSTLYEVTAVAHVVPKTLKLDTENIEFTENDPNYKFFKIINSLNAYTSFDWEVPSGAFKIYPSEGGIRAEKYLLCMVTHTPNSIDPNTTECVLTSESGQKKILTVTYIKRNHLVVFDKYVIDFGSVPFNTLVRKKLTLKNLKKFPILYVVRERNPIPGITIDPSEGSLDGLDSQVFIINVHLKGVVQFETDIVFEIEDDETVYIELKGSVEYPEIIIKPDNLFFRKISPYSFDTLSFLVKNVSNCAVWLSFPIDELPEFTVTDSEDNQYAAIGNVVLQSKEYRVLYLHFHPNYVSTYTLMLPYVVNGMIGPVYINSGRSSTPQYFLAEIHQAFAEMKDVIVKKIPRSLSVIRLNCSAIEKTLEFSSLSIEFFFFGQGHYNNMTSTKFEIKNVSGERVVICIRTDDLNEPFSLTPNDETEVEYHEVSYKVILEPGQKAVFDAEFFPKEMSDYEIKLPIFLRHYYDNKIFNYLTLRGVYGTPLMIPSTDRVDFEPVPLNTINETEISLRMMNHFEDCTIFGDSDFQDLITTFQKEIVSRVEAVVKVTLSYEHAFPICINAVLSFQCTCASTCSVELSAASENCLLTTHAFCFLLRHKGDEQENIHVRPSAEKYLNAPGKKKKKLANTNTTCYPLFPAEDDTGPYAKYMRNVQKALENWLFSQAFYMKGYCRIPEGFSDFCKVREPAQKKIFGGIKKQKIYDMPFLELIMNIAGKEVRDELALSLPTEMDENTWLTYVSITNSNILRYLRGFPVFLPHVKAKYLLNYDQYVKYENLKSPKRLPMTEDVFYRLSKQCWIDVILQIIKTFFLFRSVPVSAPHIKDHRTSIDVRYKYRHSFISMSRTSVEVEDENFLESGIYGEREMELMQWLLGAFNEVKTKLWPSARIEKQLTFLDDDLRDGLILGAVTAHYCPYVQRQIEDMYVNTYNPEELHHNACVLVQTFQMLNLSYIVSPLRFQEIGMVEMLLLVNYLYDIFPQYSPSAEIKIDALLTQSNTSVVELVNLGDDPINYKEIFFGDDNHLFTLIHDSVVIEPKSTKVVRVKFHAKTVNTCKATLLFCGETPGNKYGKSMAITIVGVPDVSYACTHIPLTVEMYKPCDITFQLQSPFKLKAAYNLQFGYQPASKEKNVLYPWEEIKQIKTVKEFVLESGVSEFDEQGQCVATHVFCCQHEGPKDMWLYFTNPDVGDWGLQITLKGKVTRKCYEQIFLTVPDNYDRLTCRCKVKPSVTTHCPMILQLNIPMKNNVLWNARKLMIMQYVQGDEHKFWVQRIYTPTGTRILKLILNSETHPMRQVIEETVTYKVKLNKPIPFVTLKKIVMEDVTSEDFYELPIHPVKDLLQVKNYIMQLISADGEEKRYYELIFKKKVDIDQ